MNHDGMRDDEACICGRDTRMVMVEVCEYCGELVDECECEPLDTSNDD